MHIYALAGPLYSTSAASIGTKRIAGVLLVRTNKKGGERRMNPDVKVPVYYRV